MAPDGNNGRGGYHHGSLREALTQAATSMIAERGLAGFALAELARALGVSTSAPYKHFRDRTAVLAEVARRGFVQLATDLEAARRETGSDLIGAVERCAQAHLAFASRDPPVYAAMFEAVFPRGEHQEVVHAREAAFHVLHEAARASVSRGTAPNRPPTHMVALHVWTMTHGIADTFVNHDGDGRRLLPMAPEAGLLLYLGSLGLIR